MLASFRWIECLSYLDQKYILLNWIFGLLCFEFVLLYWIYGMQCCTYGLVRFDLGIQCLYQCFYVYINIIYGDCLLLCLKACLLLLPNMINVGFYYDLIVYSNLKSPCLQINNKTTRYLIYLLPPFFIYMSYQVCPNDQNNQLQPCCGFWKRRRLGALKG